MPEELAIELQIMPPLQGQLDGLDPTLPDGLFPPTFAALLQNIRCAGGKWSTRYGQTYTYSLLSSGACRLLDTFYAADGTRVRLAAQGDDNAAKFFKRVEGVDTAFVAVSGGTGLGTTTGTQPYFQGTLLNDRYYFVDRAGALRKFVNSPSPLVSSVTNPAAPGAAPGVKAWTYSRLERWLGAAPHGWSRTDATDFDITAPPGTVTSPMGNFTELSVLDDPNAAGDSVFDDVANEDISSHTIAFWVHQTHVARHVQFGIGLTQADEFSEAIKTPTKDEWYPYFFQTADLPTISFKRFKCLKTTSTPAIYVTELFLPGRLSGSYRWRYTHYNSTTSQESAPSAVSNSGTPMDFSTEGISYETTTTKAFQKSAMLTFTTDDSGATTNKIRIYRSGGVPELTKDSRNRDVWLRVGEVQDYSSTLASSPAANATSFDVTSATGLAIGDYLVIEKGTSDEEFVKITNIAGATLTIEGYGATGGLIRAHTAADPVQMAFLDNVANESINLLQDIDAERDDPPTAAQWVRRAPDGRLWLLNYSGKPTGFAVSNKPTPLRPVDYETFPDAVDPLTRRSATQGWRGEIGGDTTDEAIVWGDFWRGRMHVFTRRHLYVIDALSQLEWGPNAVYVVQNIGCIAGETAQIIDGILYWVAPGPKIMRWDGVSAPEDIGHQKVTAALTGTTGTLWNRWFARAWESRWGRYYRLYYVIPGDTEVKGVLDYNITQGAWEPCVYNNQFADRMVWQAATNYDSGADLHLLQQVNSLGQILQAEDVTTTADDDLLSGNAIAIPIVARTKRHPVGDVVLCRELYLRLSGVTDTITAQVKVGGSEYGDVSRSYTLSLSGTGDAEIKQRLDRALKGRWVEITFSGSVSSRPEIRECRVVAQPWRRGRQKP